MKETRINIRISPEKKQALVQKAESEGLGLTDVLLKLIDDYLSEGKSTDLEKRLKVLEEKVGKLAA